MLRTRCDLFTRSTDQVDRPAATEHAATVDAIFDGDRSAMRVEGELAEREADTARGARRSRIPIDARVQVEDLAVERIGDTGTAVGEQQLVEIAAPAGGHRDREARRRVLRTVVEQ